MTRLNKKLLLLTLILSLSWVVFHLYSKPKGDNIIEATKSQGFKDVMTQDKGDYVFTSSHFRFTPQGLRYESNGEKFQRAVIMRVANGTRWVANFQMKWADGDSLGAGLYFAYENMAAHYYVGFSGKEIYIMRNGEKRYQVRYQTPKNTWLRIRVRRKDNRFRVWVNGVQRLDFEETRPVKDSDTERDPLGYGGYALGTDDEISEDTVVYFKGLLIQGNSCKKPLKHAYVERIKLKEGMKNVIIWLYKPDPRASQKVRIMAQSIKIMEEISGLSYPVSMAAEATVIDYKASYPFRKLGQVLFDNKHVILSNDKTQDFLNILAFQWDYFQELWLVGGFPLFLSGATVQKLNNRPFIFKNVNAFKSALDKMNDPKFKDIPVDGVYVGPEDICQEIISGKKFYVEKGSLFLYMLYRDLGEKMFAKVMNRAVENLRGKKFKRSKRINSEDFLVAVTEVAKTHYKAYFNGWIFPGKYTRWSPAFFVDNDKDGLLLMEEKIIGTSDNKVDTDNDGYSDTWEYLNGFDHKNPKKPVIAQIAVDGYVIDWANFKHNASVTDPLNDISTSYNPYDVRRVQMRADQKFLYIGVQFHNDIRLNVGKKRQRFRFRFNGKQFHSGVIDYDDGEFMAQRLKGTDLWHDYFALDKGFQIEFALDMEIRIPIDYFDGADRIELTYSGPGDVRGGKVNFKADPVSPLEVFKIKDNKKEIFTSLTGLQNHLWGFGVEEFKASGHYDIHNASMALDRRSDTYWEAKFPGDWIMLTIDKVASARSITLELDSNVKNQIWIEISTNQTDWQTVVKDETLQQAVSKRTIALQKMDQFKEKFRYVRIHMLKSSGEGGRGKINEINFDR